MNLHQFRWDRPLIIRHFDESDSDDSSSSSDGSSIISTNISNTKGLKSPNMIYNEVIHKINKQSKAVNIIPKYANRSLTSCLAKIAFIEDDGQVEK